MNYPQEDIKPYSNEGKKDEQVQRMFDNIAGTYDKLNHLLSFGIDKIWRKKAINILKLSAPKTVLDVATGTGDFALQAYEMLTPDKLIAVDISEGMMDVGRQKVTAAGLSDKISFQYENCEALSFKDDTFDAITVAFGVRNFADLKTGLKEMLRVLVPGGHLVILELTTPAHFPMKQMFTIYSKVVIPALGKSLSRDSSAYTYLPNTIKVFPQGEVMQGILEETGFTKAEFKRLTFGICTLYIATK